ncbi:MAG: adenylyltransferase [delta proteobacterium ML8_D]|nr:MAG: adenylyltransferase [delta proteobacterium ML8_D]
MPHQLIPPHGGRLHNLLVSSERADLLRRASVDLPSVDLTRRQECDLELLLNGAFSPLTGFMDQETYDSVLDTMRLPDGTVWPVPITLDIEEKLARSLRPEQQVALRDQEGFMLAVLTVDEIWRPDKKKEARRLYTTDETSHPGVAHLFEQAGPYYVSGRVEGIHLPIHFDYKTLRLTPSETRAYFKKAGWKRVVAFQTRRPLHNAHKALTLLAANKARANILLHPVVGSTSPGDIDHYARVRCYQAIARTYPKGSIFLNLLPLAMRMAGPREALLQAIINKNYGCTHFIVTPNHADPFTNTKRPAYYPRFGALELLEKFEKEIGITAVSFSRMVYVEEKAQFLVEDECPPEVAPKQLTATELRRRLEYGLEIPDWFSPPEVVSELRRAYPARSRQGFTVFFTGFSGSGKSTVAKILLTRFLEMGDRPVTLLDGDIVRRHLSSELGFSRKDRHINVVRIGFVASEITKNRGIAICAPIAPYEQSRRQNREMISQYGGYIEVYLSTPLEVCMKRDRKGLYAKGLAGRIKGVTGVDDPYEEPINADVVIDTTDAEPEEVAQEVLFCLKSKGYVGKV